MKWLDKFKSKFKPKILEYVFKTEEVKGHKIEFFEPETIEDKFNKSESLGDFIKRIEK